MTVGLPPKGAVGAVGTVEAVGSVRIVGMVGVADTVGSLVLLSRVVPSKIGARLVLNSLVGCQPI